MLFLTKINSDMFHTFIGPLKWFLGECNNLFNLHKTMLNVVAVKQYQNNNNKKQIKTNIA